MEKNFLQTFWGLSSVEEDERIKAASDLITVLADRQVESQAERVQYPVCM